MLIALLEKITRAHSPKYEHCNYNRDLDTEYAEMVVTEKHEYTK